MLSINNVVVHALVKEQHQPIQPSVFKNETLSPTDEGVKKLLEGVTKTYGSRNNSASYGIFREAGEGRGAFPDTFDHYIGLVNPSADNFLALSRFAMDELYAKAHDSGPASGGYMLFADYVHQGDQFLLVAMIKQKEGLMLTEDLKPESLMALDLTKLHQAARINFTKYRAFLSADAEAQAELVYLSFISPSQERGASGYFVTALGCQAGSTARKATDSLIKASAAFFRDNEEIKDRRLEFRDELLEYIDSKVKSESGEFIRLSEVDAIARKYMPADQPGKQDELSEAFIAFLNNEENAVPSEFKASDLALKQYQKMTVKSDHWQIKFDRSALGDNDEAAIYYDEDANKIILKGVPEGMKAILEDELGFRALDES
ncbi:MAG: nucleoid-associated protein [Porticoccaceae bacterium]